MSSSSMHVAKTGLNAHQTKMQVIANNLSNVNTSGFKRDRANFESLLYQIKRASGEQTSVDTNLTSAFAVGTGVRVNNTQKVYTQGSLINTDNALDMAIDGAGFFKFYFLMEELVSQEMVLLQETKMVFLPHQVVTFYSLKLQFQKA